MMGRRKDWRLERRRQLWHHVPTGICFAVEGIQRHGWERPLIVVGMASSWREFVDAFPLTTLDKERGALLVAALDEHDETRLRALTLRWSLWKEETDTMGEVDGG